MLAATLNDGRLIVTGTDADDVIVLSQDKGSVTVVINGESSSFPVGGVRGVRVSALGGDDRVDARKLALHTIMNGGLGADTLRGGSGNDMLHGGEESRCRNALCSSRSSARGRTACPAEAA